MKENLFPEWKGDLFVGALVNHEVRQAGSCQAWKVIGEEALFSELAVRIRDVRNGPDGVLYILTPDRVRPGCAGGLKGTLNANKNSVCLGLCAIDFIL